MWLSIEEIAESRPTLPDKHRDKTLTKSYGLRFDKSQF